ncbi:rRNA-processing protein fyv7-like [Glossina fuscipes]|uniref:rRNA-processing protein fyv7-like n=1 Tax=Glossina fuscipes TaxID=7396 RepID=A0A9C5ZFI0_9MUSC|nr:rRNA-processing protein fyv7-like [Glossina fuscipes]XP_037899507.1 rRNA-processing protein fyv7-like [Glossina fuscipes]
MVNNKNSRVKVKQKSQMKTKSKHISYKNRLEDHAQFNIEQQNKNRKFQKIEEQKVLRSQKALEIAEGRAKERAEKERRIEASKKKRLERTKIFSKRTRNGQPLMKDRMQLLLKQIQEMKNYG